MVLVLVKLVLQGLQTVYTPLKDTVSYMKDKAKYVEKLQGNLAKITAELATFYAKKDEIDQILTTTVSREKSDVYDILVMQIEGYKERYDEYFNRYRRIFQNLPSSQAHDVASAIDVISTVQKQKPTILTCKFFKLAKLSRKISELFDDVSKVTGEMNPENVLRGKKIEPVLVKYDDTIDLPSSTEYVRRILRYLIEDGNRSVGVLGAIGVGKTTILKELNNRLKQMKTLRFDVVIWIDCHRQRAGAKGEATEVIQDLIMERLKLEHEKVNNNVGHNADIISRFLCDKKYILLIDQVSSAINLNEVGIHKGHKHGKVVVASSSRKVIMRMTDEQVEIQKLSKNEAWNLFLEVCGAIHDTRIKDIAECIIESCGGLPLVIKLVANHLRGQRDEEVWSDVKRLLQSETKAKLQSLEGVGNAYKLAYDTLDNSHKKCLLFVTSFPSDHKIYKDYLVECWNGERLLEDVRYLRSARDRGATTLRELTDQYLLENHSDRHVKMPGYFRKVAAEQEYPGENDGWRATRMSLMSKSTLPSRPECANVSALLMQRNRGLVSFEDGFFHGMQKLLILDLHKTKIESLPKSISSLVSLRCLYLNGCSLLSSLPPEVKTLKKLELLDIRGTSIRALPDGMGDMLELRCLRISFEVEMAIHLRMIGQLEHLEEVTIEAGYSDRGWNDVVDRIVVELACLEKLSTLNFHFPRVSSLVSFVSQSRSLQNTETHWGMNTLRSFNISVGCCEARHPCGSQISPERRLRLCTDEEISSVTELREVLRQANSLELVGHSSMRNLSEFGLKNAGALKACVVERCTNMTSLVVVDKAEADDGALKCLEELHLFDLRRLRSVWRGPVRSGSLASLKELTIFGCAELTTVLNHELARALSNLERVRVEKCPEVVAIIVNEDDDGITEDAALSDVLNKVTAVELVDLPMLEGVCEATSVNLKSLTRIVIKSCNSLKDAGNIPRNMEKVVVVECEESWWMGLPLPEEHRQRFLPEFIAPEEKPAEGVLCHGGEYSSRQGRSSNLVVPNADVCNGEVVASNGSNVKHDHQDMPESSTKGVERATRRLENGNAPTNGEALSLPVDRCSKIGVSISSH